MCVLCVLCFCVFVFLCFCVFVFFFDVLPLRGRWTRQADVDCFRRVLPLPGFCLAYYQMSQTPSLANPHCPCGRRFASYQMHRLRGALRAAEFGPEARAGFCLMGACQDCWVWQERFESDFLKCVAAFIEILGSRKKVLKLARRRFGQNVPKYREPVVPTAIPTPSLV